MLEVVRRHLARYPLMQPVDIYKLLFQASMGPSHAIGDISAAKERLDAEMSSLTEGHEEPLIDPISPSGRLVRIHLRSWMKAGLQSDILLEAFSDTATDFYGSREVLEEWCGHLLSPGIELESEASRLHAEVIEFGFPAMHHSNQYCAAYSPAYRVVLREHLPALLRGRMNA